MQGHTTASTKRGERREEEEKSASQHQPREKWRLKEDEGPEEVFFYCQECTRRYGSGELYFSSTSLLDGDNDGRRGQDLDRLASV